MNDAVGVLDQALKNYFSFTALSDMLLMSATLTLADRQGQHNLVGALRPSAA